MSKRTMIYEPQSVGAASKLAWNPNAQSSLTIGAKRFILTGLVLTFEINKYWDTVTEVVNQDWLFRTITGLQLSGGGRTYLSISGPDLRILYWAHRLRSQGRDRVCDYVPQGTAPTGTNIPVHIRYSLPILFNPGVISFDDTENIAGRLCGIRTTDDLTLSMGFGVAGTNGTPITVPSLMASHSVIQAPSSTNASWIGVDYLGYFPTNDSELPAWYPMWSATQSNNLTQAYPSLGYQVPVPMGQWARRTTIMILNGASPADVRTNGFNGDATHPVAGSPVGGPYGGISEVGFMPSSGNTPIYQKTPAFAALSQSQFSMADDNTEYTTGITPAYGVATARMHVNPGVGHIDWAAQADLSDPALKFVVSPDFGVNLTGQGSTALNTVFTVDNPTNTNIVQLHEQYQQYPRT